MLESALIALKALFTISGILYTALGAAVGYIFGFLPGLTASVALSLLIPITYGMQANYALMMLAGVLGGVCFGGSISSIVINAPGTGSSAATSIDGYELSQQGRAGEALGASASASFLGHLLGIVVLIAVIPVMTYMVLAFGPPEWFALGLGGLFLIASVSGKSMLNGLIAGCLGLLFSMHGVNPVIGAPRFTFGQMWLWDGLPLVPVIVGLMALGELIRLYSENRSISQTGKIKTGGTWKGVKATLSHLPLVGLSGIIGIIIGAIPGVGGNISTWIALSQAKAMSKTPELFGKGCIEGVIAPEAANDATEGGALMPLLSLGIPGSPSTAVLLGAFIMHGIQPGRDMLTSKLDILFTISFAHLFGALIACTLGLYLATYLAKITVIPSRLLVPVLCVICITGAFATRGRFSDVVLTIALGLVGFAMVKCSIPRVPVLLGLILGPLIERSYQVSLQLSDGSLSIFFTRPFAVLFMLLIPLSVVITAYFGRRGKSKQADTCTKA